LRPAGHPAHSPPPMRVLGVPRPHRELGEHLDALLTTFDPAARRVEDPVSFVHRYHEAGDREVVALVAASLAFGNVKAVRASVGRVLATLGPEPARFVDHATPKELRDRLHGFVHRVYRGPDLASLLGRAGRVRRRHGSLGHAMACHLDGAGGDLREGLARFADELRGPRPGPGLAHLVSDPRAGSACKRLLLYLRWMVRPADGVDLGQWPLSPSVLLVPVDTHIHRIGRNLGLTRRATASWRAAEDITASLRRYDPEDPVKYDFALCHLGVSRDCPSQRDTGKCGRCVLRDVCGQWGATAGTGRAASRGSAAPRAR
jgi:uncharacterized protein (TIGR02757 family)